MPLLADKVAIVTGAASGIGRATAELFAREGARVLIADLDETGGANTAAAITEAGGEAIVLRTDVTRAADNAAMVAAAVARWGKLDIGVNNAGTTGGFTNVETMTEDEWDQVMAINAKSVFLAMKYEIPALRQSGGGAIVNTSSASTHRTQPGMASYIASKHAVNGLTLSAAKDFAHDGIRVNALLPGVTWTPMMAKGMEGNNMPEAEWKNLMPMGRLGEAHEQAGAVLWLCSPLSSYVTGVVLRADGGAGV
jgi:NAD(P)-dependent dehydrogenase (short-subunit alcohol dehydrogenase family)